MKNLVSAAAAVVALAVAGSASAATYVFSFDNADRSDAYGAVDISGTFTVAGDLASMITGITGTVSGGATPNLTNGAITGLSPYADADNALYAVGAGNNDVSFSGVSFDVGGEDYNLFTNNGGTYLLASGIDPVGYAQNGTPGAFSVSPAPEPAAWAMMLVGFGGLGMAMRSRRNPALATA